MNKTAIYTAIFGNKDECIKPSFVTPECDFICFTDHDMRSDVWRMVKVEPILNDPTRSARHYKILAHRFLSDYEYSIWVDGNMLVRGDVTRLVDAYLASHPMAVYDHAQTRMDPRNSVAQEVAALIARAAKRKEDNVEMVKKQLEQYRKEGFPDTNGLISSMVMLRKHHHPDVVKAMEGWWKEIQTYSNRDQVSFNYVAWKHKLDFIYMNGDSRDNKFFLWRPHVN